MAEILQINNLHAGLREGGKEIIKGLNLAVRSGEIHAIMGRNGAGKSTLSYVLAGKNDYAVTSGEIIFKGRDLLGLSAAERAAEGVFLSMQYPVAIPGINVSNFLKHAVNAQRRYKGLAELDSAEFLKLLRQKSQEIGVEAEMLKREINVGFSGGEKKRLEILQMSILEPQLAILDEADSGLDIDALQMVSAGVRNWHNADNALLIITHHDDIFKHIRPDFVHIYDDGRIIRSGGKELAAELENHGYKHFFAEEK